MPYPQFKTLSFRFRFGTFLFQLFDSRIRIVLTGCVVGAIAAFIEFVVHEVIRTISVSEDLHAALDAISVGIALGGVACALMFVARERRKRVLRDMTRVAELNHNVRNALQVIAHSHYGVPSDHAAMVLESVERIEKTLKTLFPVPNHPHNPPPKVQR